MHGLFRWSSKWWPGVIPLVVFWAIACWTSTPPLEADLAARSTAALKDTVLDKRRITVAGRDVTFAADAFSEEGRRSAVASVEVGARRAAGRRRNPSGSRSQAIRLVGGARRRQGDARRQRAVAGQQRQVAGGGARRSRRRRGRRSDEFVARRAAAFRRCGVVAARPDRKIERRQDHDHGRQGQPFRHGARPRRPGSDRGCAEKSSRRLFGRRQRDQGAALCVPGLQGSGRGDGDAERLRAGQ